MLNLLLLSAVLAVSQGFQMPVLPVAGRPASSFRVRQNRPIPVSHAKMTMSGAESPKQIRNDHVARSENAWSNDLLLKIHTTADTERASNIAKYYQDVVLLINTIKFKLENELTQSLKPQWRRVVKSWEIKYIATLSATYESLQSQEKAILLIRSRGHRILREMNYLLSKIPATSQDISTLIDVLYMVKSEMEDADFSADSKEMKEFMLSYERTLEYGSDESVRDAAEAMQDAIRIGKTTLAGNTAQPE